MQDCNHNWIPDNLELPGHDCNNNGILDECDIASGTSVDCNQNGIPDDCEDMTAPVLTIQYTDSGQLMLHWNCAVGATSYHLYGKHGADAEALIATVPGTSYDATSLLSGADPQRWTFRVNGVR